ncbi:zinc ribbon domain-containing protein [Okeania sp. SIO2B3]|uniref:zinc ribbon domain-containing protein n=1 Tax=Okeania sp. SIO2B3 TaxID=2607784 RepID=UPI0025D77A3D|nr:zinc ribbon domain-containing protein [Okeania sp. SIO2B3]
MGVGADCGFYEFKRQLTYKCEWYGSELVIADRFYPSSQICSNCGHQQKMPLNLRTYVSAALRNANVVNAVLKLIEICLRSIP